jgi:8-oxo-dGTP pyrophosphatase MutT (NUDIX family)
MMLYEHLSECPKVDGFSRIVAAFGIVGRESSLSPNTGLPVLLMKQRNGDGEFPWCWDLPGGAADPEDAISDDDRSIEGKHDRSIRKTLQREILEEVHVRSDYHFRIGAPLYEVRTSERKLVEYHLFLTVPFGPPKESREAINLAWVNPQSALGLKVAGLAPESKSMGPMAILMYDGFSVLSKPMYVGPLTKEIARLACSDLSSNGFSLLDRGAYFGRLASDGSVKIYRRLNPFVPRGYFVGALECLA